MKQEIRGSLPSPAMMVALIALVVALGGTSYAAITLPQNSVGARQIKKNAVSSVKVKDRSLLAKDFKAGQLPQGATGPAGGALTGSYPNPSIAAGVITDSMVAAANKDGAAGVPSMRTLGTGALQAMPGNATPGGPPTGSAGGALSGTYPNPGIAEGSVGPLQRGPSPAARVSLDGGLPVPNSVATKVVFNEVDFDNSGFVSAGSDGLTANASGVYVISGGAGWLDPSNNGARRMRILVDGNPVADEVLPGNQNINQRQNASAVVSLAAGEQITMELFQNSGVQISTQDSTQGSAQLSAAWVSP